MPKTKRAVKLVHFITERVYIGGRDGGWETHISNRAVSEPHVLCQPGEDMEIDCTVEGCNQTLILHLHSAKEYAHLRRQRIQRFIIGFFAAYLVIVAGGMLPDIQGWLAPVGVVLCIVGALVTLRLLWLVIFERTPRCTLTPKDGSSGHLGGRRFVCHSAKLS